MASGFLPRSEGFVPSSSGSRLYYRRLGRGPQTVVIPLATWWGSQADVLADRMDVVLYDPRGRGRSDAITDDTPVGIDAAVADLESVRLHLDLQRISLIGWSYLGAVVMLYAAAHLPAVDRIVLVGPLVPRREPFWGQFMADYSARAARVGEQDVCDRALRPDESDSGAPANATVVRRKRLAAILPQLGDTSVAGRIVDTVGTDLPNEDPDTLAKLSPKSMAAVGNWDFRAAAGDVTAPVLIVRGSDDNIPLAGCVEWVDVLPNARLLRIAGAGHYPFYERPAGFFAAVGEFLDGHWPAESDERPER